MKSLEQFRAEQQAAAAKAEAAHVEMLARAELIAAAGFPIPEYIAEGNLYGAVGLTYRNKATAGIREPADPRSMAQAVALFRQFAESGKVVPFHVLKASCTILHPEQHITERLKREGYKRDAYKSAGYAAELRVVHRVDGHHTTATLEFFAAFGGKLWGVSVEFGRGYIGQCGRLAPKVEIERGFRNEIVARRIFPNADANALADRYLSYSYGGDYGPNKTGADHRFLFVADHDDEGPAECSHALAQLENLAAIVDGVTK